ncbi:trafficking protein particle complex subunit 3 [Striga asiatica]|uniref:Trafficking protein particle complex subunit 3 n=1 Tax=Striga asiatica TaxID=4170 RepID=A0A5A7QNZ8_STRAF|nr:trafficking protein particle complex subunit 3 [Striga asiatica]
MEKPPSRQRRAKSERRNEPPRATTGRSHDFAEEGGRRSKLSKRAGGVCPPGRNAGSTLPCHGLRWKSASDHFMLVVEANPGSRRSKRRFHFDKRWVKKE